MSDFDSPSSPSTSVDGQSRKSATSTPASTSSVSTLSSSVSASTRSIQLKEAAVEALQLIRSRSSSVQPADKFTHMFNYMADKMRELSPEKAKFAERKLLRLFNEVMEEVEFMVNTFLLLYRSIHEIAPILLFFVSVYLSFPRHRAQFCFNRIKIPAI